MHLYQQKSNEFENMQIKDKNFIQKLSINISELILKVRKEYFILGYF